MRTLWALALLVLSTLPLTAAGKLLILDYHTFLNTGRSSMDNSLAEFGAQLDRMRTLGWTLVSLDEALAGHLTGDRNIAITIDDGHQSVYDDAKKVLLPRDVPTELFVFPNPLDRSPHYLKVSRLKELLADGMSLGAHGYFHLPMTPTSWKKNPKSVLFEAERPAAALTKLTGRLPQLFAYPYGVAAPEAQAAVRAAGYSWAFLADGHLQMVDPLDPALNHWAVPRTIVYRSGVKALFQFLAQANMNKI